MNRYQSKMKNLYSLLIIFAFTALSAPAQQAAKGPEDFIHSRTTDGHGREIVRIIVPGQPPPGHREPAAPPSRSSSTLVNVPAFDWSFGCSATSAAMAAGYYDNNGYVNMYTGPANGGVMPMNNSIWGTAVINGETRSLCPLSATMNGLDGRTIRGHVDDFWYSTAVTADDPYITNGWTPHAYGDCTGDFMGTNQSALGNVDGSTIFAFYPDGTPLYNYTGGEPGMIDGCHGLRDFYESRGYTVLENFSQYIYGLDGNTIGFTFDQYKQEIDAGRPVLIQVSGHTMLGYGYDDTGNTVYLHDTWDYNSHIMTWGGSYAGMAHYAVTVVRLEQAVFGPIADFTASSLSPQTFSTVTLTDQSAGGPLPNSWTWSVATSTFNFVNSTGASTKNPQVQFTAPGTYTISLTVSNGLNSDTETKTDYITAYDCSEGPFPLTEIFSSQALPPCWEIIDHENNGQVWQFNNPGNRTINTPTGAGGFAILDSDRYGSGNSQDCDLVTPPMNFTDAIGVMLKFHHHFQDYEGSAATLSYSVNNGSTWTVLQTWTTSTNNAEAFSMDVSQQVAGYSQVRFKWNYTGTWGFWWALDDVEINEEIAGLWTGAVSTVWSTPGNWADGAVPGAATDVFIHPQAQHWPAVDNDLTVGSACSSLTLFSGTSMNINGDLNISGSGSLIFQDGGVLELTGDWNNSGLFDAGAGTVAFTGTGSAEVSGFIVPDDTIISYTRSTFNKSIIPLVDATVWGTAVDDAAVDVPLGFTFYYAGGAYTQAHLCSNGWLSLNGSGGTSTSNANLFTNTTPNCAIAPWMDDLRGDANSTFSYKTEGSAPERAFTAEWYLVLSYYSGATARLSFQAKLYEGTGIIEFHYGNASPNGHNASESASMAIEDHIGGSGHFIEGSTGSTTAPVTNLKSPANWPTVNYRFTPPAHPFTEHFHHLVISKTGAVVNFNVNATVTGNMSVTNGAIVNLSEGVSVEIGE
jgi:PKD repeat protein